MTIYLETSAVLSWVLEEPEAAAVEGALVPARGFLTSELTRAECLRALRRFGASPTGREFFRLEAFRTRWDLVPVELASLDRRVRDNARALGFVVVP